MSETQTCIGNVHYNNNEFLIRKAFINVDNTTHKDDERSRCAYLVVSRQDTINLSGNLTDEKKVLEDIKTEYSDVLEKAIKEESQKVNTKGLAQNEIPTDNKLVFLQSIPIEYANKLESIFKTKKFYSECKNLSEELKQKDASKGIALLQKSREQCDDILLKESKECSKKLNSNDMKQAYALILVSYVYNYDKDLKLVHTLEKGTESVTLMPKIQLEYGVFFDGTNNNMYNIDFFQDYKTYIKAHSDYIDNNFSKPILIEDYVYKNVVDIITHHPDPENYPNIKNMVRNEIVEKIRYFEPSSTLLNNYGRDKASKDSKKVFDFLVEVRNTLKDEDSNFENIVESLRGKDWVKGKDDDIDKFIVKELIPNDNDSASYTNGYTNIKRLYEHYEGNDSLITNPNANKYDLKRLKVYASGSGTIDPVDNVALDEDSIFGLGLGLGKTGVDAHIVYTCDKIVKEMRDNNITFVDELVFDVFGFSRGATEARQFVCSLQKEFDLVNKEDRYLKYALNTDSKNIFSCFYPEDNGLYIKINNKIHFNPLITDVKQVIETVSLGGRSGDIPHRNPYYNESSIDIKSISFRHVNIGDTVTHYGVMQSNDSSDLNIHFDKQKVGSVFHLMAADEYRYNFEAHSIFESKYDSFKKEDENLKEYTVPGAHADVGGGYENADSTERVTILGYYSGDEKIKEWNNKYKWIDTENIKLIGADHSFVKLEKEGIYYKKYGDSYKDNRLGVNMYRTNLSWEYELVTLDLMHAEAIGKLSKKNEKDRVPFKKFLDSKYKISYLKKKNKLDSKNYELLSSVSSKLKAFEKVDEKLHKQLRSKYIHHSSDLGLVNKPSMEGNKSASDEIYGKRVIYGSKGELFS